MLQLYREGKVEEAVTVTITHFKSTLAAIEPAHARGAL